MMTATLRGIVAIFVIIWLFGFQSGCDEEKKKAATVSKVASDRPVERFEFNSGAQLEQLINNLNYTPEA